MIVIVIIGVLAAALIPKLIAIQSRARDLQRRVDIQNIASALMLYYSDHSSYPVWGCNTPNCSWSWSTSKYPGFLTKLEWSYLKSIPKDPQHEQDRWYWYSFSPAILSAEANYIRNLCNTNFSHRAVIAGGFETNRPDDPVRSCPNNIPWDYIAHALPEWRVPNRYTYSRDLRIFDDKYAPLGQVKAPWEIFEKTD